MKIMVFEFTLTYAGLVSRGLPDVPGGEGPTQIRCRVTTDKIGGLQVFWLETNLLDEKIWRGGHHDSGPPPLVGGHWLDRENIVMFALQLVVERPPGLGSAIRELPNGAIVFDLGTV